MMDPKKHKMIEIEKIARKDVIVGKLFAMHMAGKLTRDQALMAMVVELCQRSEELESSMIDSYTIRSLKEKKNAGLDTPEGNGSESVESVSEEPVLPMRVGE